MNKKDPVFFLGEEGLSIQGCPYENTVTGLPSLLTREASRPLRTRNDRFRPTKGEVCALGFRVEVTCTTGPAQTSVSGCSRLPEVPNRCTL